MSDPVIILGAGLAGLTAGRILGESGSDYLIVEAKDRPGGLCRTETVDGFTFDYTGHLLHLRKGGSRDLILGLVGDRLDEHTRRASIRVEGVFVDYPIQAHFGQLPEPRAGQCLEELLEIGDREVPGGVSFDRWAELRFGRTLAELFMIPYNSKLSIHPLEEMETSWTSWSVPVPTVQDLEKVRQGGEFPSYGYNMTFFYPREGGIEILPRRLLRGQETSIRTGAGVVHVDAVKRRVTLKDGTELAFGDLISTIPLPELLRITEGLPSYLAEAAGRLRYSSVLGVCLGLDGPILRPDHWVYFPDRTLPFYRTGFPTNFSDQVAPEGCGSVYAEVAHVPGPVPDAQIICDTVLKTLKGTGLVDRGTQILAKVEMAMPYAYVFHDMYRARNLGTLLEALKTLGIRSVGRYGAWEYSSMQDAVDWGLRAAREVLD